MLTVGAHSSPRIRGTRNRCSSAAGAPASACSCGEARAAPRPSRKTLVSGSGCDVGGDVVGVEGLRTPRDGLEDRRQLAGETVELGVVEVDAREPGEVGDLVAGDVRHAGNPRSAAARRYRRSVAGTGARTARASVGRPARAAPEAGLVEDRHPELPRPCRPWSRRSRPPRRSRSSSTPTGGLAAAGRIASLASSREKPSSEPVTTIGQALEGARRRPSTSSSMPHAGGRPLVDDRRGASRRRTTRSTASAMRQPDALGRRRAPRRRPRGSRRSSRSASASARAAVGPDVPDGQRRPAPATAAATWPCRGWRAAARRWRRAPGRRRPPRVGLLRARVNERRPAASCRRVVEGEEVALVGDDPGLEQGDGGLVAEHLDVEGPAAGHVEQPLAQLGRAGARGWGSGCRRRPPSPGAASVPHAGHSVGITNARSVPSRRSTTGPTISGMTSPALRSTTRVADQHALAARPPRRCAAWPSRPSSRRRRPAPSRRTA